MNRGQGQVICNATMILRTTSIFLIFSSFAFVDGTLDDLAGVKELLRKVLDRNVELERRLAHLEEENDILKQINVGLEQRLTQLEKANDYTGRLVKRSRGHGQFSGRSMQGIKDGAKRFVSDLQGTSVAFTAVVSPPQLTNLGAGQAVIYDKIVTDVGGDYHNTSGVFTAPLSAVYAFNYAVMMDPGLSEYIELVKNGKHIIWNYGHAPGASHLISASRTAVVELVAGDQVWIRTQRSSTHGNGIIHGNGFTTFSGWLISMYE